MATMRTFITTDFRRRGFTYAELMLVVILLALAACFTGSSYLGTYKKTALKSAARALLLMGQYARIRAVEGGQACQLHIDRERGQFYLVAPLIDKDGQAAQRAVVRNPYCRKKILDNGILFEYVDITPTTGETGPNWDNQSSITFYPDGSCDSAVIQMGNGKHRVTAVFSSAYANVKIYEGLANSVAAEIQVIDLDATE